MSLKEKERRPDRIEELQQEIDRLRRRLEESESSVKSILEGAADALMVPGPEGIQIYTREGAESAYRLFVESMDDGAVTLDRSGGILYCNRRFSRMTGIPMEKITGAPFTLFLRAGDRERFKAGLEAPDDQESRMELELTREPKGFFPVQLVFNRIESGKTVRTGVVIRDLTLEKKHQEEISNRQAFLQTIMDSLPVGLYVLDKQGSILQSNPEAQKIWCGSGRSDSGYSGKYQAWWTENRKRIKPEEWIGTRAAKKGVVSLNKEMDIQCFDGTKKTILGSALPLWNEKKEPFGALVVIQDITELKERNQELLQFTAAAEEIGESIAAVRRDGVIRYTNRAFLSIHGIKKKALGKNYFTLMMESGCSPEKLNNLKSRIKESAKWKDRLRLNKHGGGELELEVSLYPVRDKYGRVVNFVLVERDMTQQIKYQERIQQMQKMEALGTLSSGIAHDLNNILNPILLNTEMLLFENPSGSNQERLEMIREAGRRGRDLVKQIGIFSTRKEKELETERLGPVIEEALNLAASSLPKNIKIKKNINTEAAAFINASQIHQVVLNLASNAEFAMKEEGGEFRVDLDEALIEDADISKYPHLTPGEYLRLTVRDTGKGMPPEVKEKIFDPFFSTKGPGEGSGIGLAVVHGIVHRHKGCLSVDSEPGKGTAFRMFFPMSREEAEIREEKKPEIRSGTERVLFVDDEPMQAEVGQRVLEKLGYDVVSSTSSFQALELFQENPGAFDLVITDLSMPDLTGTQLTRKIMDIRPETPVILSTGYGDTVDIKDAEKLGIKGFLSKPFSIREISEKIREILD